MSGGYVYSTANFGEPEPLANRQGTILGVCISMMVCFVGRFDDGDALAGLLTRDLRRLRLGYV
jgi:hypothetical protein